MLPEHPAMRHLQHPGRVHSDSQGTMFAVATAKVSFNSSAAADWSRQPQQLLRAHRQGQHNHWPLRQKTAVCPGPESGWPGSMSLK